jgi:hypothetical protein
MSLSILGGRAWCHPAMNQIVAFCYMVLYFELFNSNKGDAQSW